ncbi:unnamed protein product [Sphagnum balticum]
MPTFVIIHGGFWRAIYNVDNSLIETLQPALSKLGYGVCLVEYRRNEHVGGGWPGTNDDIISALKRLHEYSKVWELVFLQSSKVKYTASQGNHVMINFEKVVVLGHSAGTSTTILQCRGHSHALLIGATLALWCCSSAAQDLPFRPVLCAALAPVGDLNAGFARGLGDKGDAVMRYMGGRAPVDQSPDCPYK